MFQASMKQCHEREYKTIMKIKYTVYELVAD